MIAQVTDWADSIGAVRMRRPFGSVSSSKVLKVRDASGRGREYGYVPGRLQTVAWLRPRSHPYRIGYGCSLCPCPASVFARPGTNVLTAATARGAGPLC